MKRNLAQLRAALKIFRGNVAAGRDEKLVNLEYKFFFKGDDDEATEISEEDFNAAPGDESGHPMPGTYEVRVSSSVTGEVFLKETGTWQEKKELNPEEKEHKESLADAAKKYVAIGLSIAENANFEVVKQRRNAQEAEARARELSQEKDDLSRAIKGLKDEVLQAEKQRDEAFVQRDRAFEERDAIADELEAFQQRGGELRPLAEAGVTKAIDRVAEIFEIHNPAKHREMFEECQGNLVDSLMGGRLSDLISLCHAGEIEWSVLRYLIFSYYAVDPGQEPVSPDWQPPETQTEPEPEPTEEPPPPPPEAQH